MKSSIWQLCPILQVQTLHYFEVARTRSSLEEDATVAQPLLKLTERKLLLYTSSV